MMSLLVSFVLSVVIIIAVTILSEKLGTKIGGIIGTLPHLVVVIFIFIVIEKGEAFAVEASASVPAEMGINLIFLLVFTITSKKSLITGLIASGIVWLLCSAIVYLIKLDNIYFSFGVFAVSWIVAILLLEVKYKAKSSGKRVVKYTPLKLLFRGGVAGAVAIIAILMSHIHPVLTGIFSVFPVMFLSTMVIVYRAHGAVFASGIAKSMIFGAVSVASYPVVFYFVLPQIGLTWTVIVGLGASVVITFGLVMLRKKLT